jgi:hypothetical protein
MAKKTAVNVQLDPEDAEKLEALKDHFRIDKSATVVRLLVRDGYDRLTEGAPLPTSTKVKKNAGIIPLAS